MARSFVAANSDYLSRSGAIFSAYPFTFACWTAPTGTGGNIFSVGNTSSDSYYFRLIAAADNLSFSVGALSEGFVNYGSPATGVLSGEWRHVAVVAGSSTSRSTWYGGAQIGSSASPATYPTGLNVTALGTLYRTTRTTHLTGAIAHAAFWSASLSSAEIASLATGTSPLLIRPASLIEYWPLRGLACDAPEPGVYSGRNLSVVGTSWARDPSPVWSPSLRVHDGQPWYSPLPGGGAIPSTAAGQPVGLDPVSRSAFGPWFGVRALGSPSWRD